MSARVQLLAGITPAYAGTICPLHRGRPCGQDHPRLRGDHLPRPCATNSPTGSPPPTRGPYVIYRRHRCRQRITPAYAGTIASRLRCERNRWDHPRLRGDHTSWWWWLSLRGSPPPTRGPSAAQADGMWGPGITPAYAGTISGGMSAVSTFRDHPRLRGDHTQETWAESLGRGSPPPTRGPSDESGEGTCTGGITPAYAGTMVVVVISGFLRGDHPRLRGDHVATSMKRLMKPGSPPPTRGPL